MEIGSWTTLFHIRINCSFGVSNSDPAVWNPIYKWKQNEQLHLFIYFKTLLVFEILKHWNSCEE